MQRPNTKGIKNRNPGDRCLYTCPHCSLAWNAESLSNRSGLPFVLVCQALWVLLPLASLDLLGGLPSEGRLHISFFLCLHV